MKKAPQIAVFTGDVVNSQKLPANRQKTLSKWIEEAATFARLGPRIEIFRGDSWQAYSEDPQNAFAEALILYSYLLGRHGIETRIAIGMGTVDSLRPDKVSLSQGEAFVLSGKSLDSIEEGQRIAIATSADWPHSESRLIAASASLLDALVSNWTNKQAYAIALAASAFPAFEDARQQDLAKRFDPPITPQAFGKHLDRADWKNVKDALRNIRIGIGLISDR